MRRWVMLLPLLLGLGARAWATTWTCVKDFQVVQEGYYEVVGTCTPSGTYTVGGDALGASASAKDTAQAVCHTNNQTLVDFIISPSSDGAATSGATLTFDHTNNKLQCFAVSPCTGTQALTAGAATVTAGCVGTTVVSGSNIVCGDLTAAAAVKCVASAGTITITGTGTDLISFVVIPANGVLGECTTGATPPKFRFRAVCK